WPGTPFKEPQPGGVTIVYYVPDEKNHLVKKSATFKVHSRPKLEGVLDDPDLTPEFPGITDKLDIANWENPPFPFDRKRVDNKEDDAYWKRYKTTPKAYVNLKTAQKLWSSRFGDLTSMQFRLGQEHPDSLPD